MPKTVTPIYFYPRSPCGERPSIKPIFGKINTNFYPRSPCGERHGQGANNRPEQQISIHALLAESDFKPPVQTHRKEHFYPRSPCGERPLRKYPVILGRVISIHALLAESDYILVNTFLEIFEFLSTLSLRRATSGTETIATKVSNFYPRSPCGERRPEYFFA